jgi:hypothetical protein
MKNAQVDLQMAFTEVLRVEAVRKMASQDRGKRDGNWRVEDDRRPGKLVERRLSEGGDHQLKPRESNEFKS